MFFGSARVGFDLSRGRGARRTSTALGGKVGRRTVSAQLRAPRDRLCETYGSPILSAQSISRCAVLRGTPPPPASPPPYPAAVPDLARRRATAPDGAIASVTAPPRTATATEPPETG